MNEELINKAASEYMEALIEKEVNTYDIDYDESNYEAGKRNALMDFGKEIFKAGAKQKSLAHYTDAEIRAEISRRIAERKAAKASVNRCRMCKHFGAIDYCGHDTSGLPPRYSCPCKFFKTKNGKYYRVHQPSQPACEHFERKE